MTGWNSQIFSLELVPISYFFVWAIALFSINGYNHYAILFLVVGILITLYFIILHAFIDSWDRIRRWFIVRARKRGGTENMTLEDVKYLLIYTRRIFRVKASQKTDEKKELDVTKLRISLINNKRWKYALNLVIIIELLVITTGGIIGFINKTDILEWMNTNWYYLFIFIVPLFIVIIGLYISRKTIRDMINELPAESFEDVLLTLNEFRIFGIKSNHD